MQSGTPQDQEQKSDVPDELRCSTILDGVFLFPWALNCGHVFERGSIARVITYATAQETEPTCPLCRGPIEQSFFLHHSHKEEKHKEQEKKIEKEVADFLKKNPLYYDKQHFDMSTLESLLRGIPVSDIPGYDDLLLNKMITQLIHTDRLNTPSSEKDKFAGKNALYLFMTTQKGKKELEENEKLKNKITPKGKEIAEKCIRAENEFIQQPNLDRFKRELMQLKENRGLSQFFSTLDKDSLKDMPMNRESFISILRDYCPGEDDKARFLEALGEKRLQKILLDDQSIEQTLDAFAGEQKTSTSKYYFLAVVSAYRHKRQTDERGEYYHFYSPLFTPSKRVHSGPEKTTAAQDFLTRIKSPQQVVSSTDDVPDALTTGTLGTIYAARGKFI